MAEQGIQMEDLKGPGEQAREKCLDSLAPQLSSFEECLNTVSQEKQSSTQLEVLGLTSSPSLAYPCLALLWTGPESVS